MAEHGSLVGIRCVGGLQKPVRSEQPEIAVPQPLHFGADETGKLVDDHALAKIGGEPARVEEDQFQFRRAGADLPQDLGQLDSSRIVCGQIVAAQEQGLAPFRDSMPAKVENNHIPASGDDTPQSRCQGGHPLGCFKADQGLVGIRFRAEWRRRRETRDVLFREGDRRDGQRVVMHDGQTEYVDARQEQPPPQGPDKHSDQCQAQEARRHAGRPTARGVNVVPRRPTSPGAGRAYRAARSIGHPSCASGEGADGNELSSQANSSAILSTKPDSAGQAGKAQEPMSKAPYPEFRVPTSDCRGLPARGHRELNLEPSPPRCLAFGRSSATLRGVPGWGAGAARVCLAWPPPLQKSA